MINTNANRFLVLITIVAWVMVSSMTHAESLYDPESFQALVVDKKAARIGDVLIVQIVENATATSSTDAAAQRANQSGVRASLPRLSTHGAEVNSHSGFDNRGNTRRSGRLLAQISVQVTGVRTNGDLEIGGRQEIAINNEKQMISVSGVVRPKDIDEGNLVLSSRVSEGVIHYTGDGDLAAWQRPAWWSRLLTWLGW